MVEMMNEIDIPYNTRSSCRVEVDIDGNITDFTKKMNYRCDKAKTSRYGLKSIRWLGPKIWALIPEEVKKVTSLDIFKLKMKEFSFNDCPCSLCKDYISGVGFIN